MIEPVAGVVVSIECGFGRTSISISICEAFTLAELLALEPGDAVMKTCGPRVAGYAVSLHIERDEQDDALEVHF